MRTIEKLLVANRGEIAIRVFRGARELGISTIAVYSEIDRDAPHSRYADEAFLLGETPPADSYLNIQKIIEVAEKAGADAIHPGYGFLAENATFAEKVISSGLIWVGPPPEAITTMGDKIKARKAASEAGVSSVPGSTEPISGPHQIAAFADEYGWPVAIKAAHGGGGRGFRVVNGPDEAQAAFEGAEREAGAAFGNSELYLERYLEGPRHIEVQIVGDQQGNVVHLGERDCSLQRRHQKLIEESPSPRVDAELRERMGAAATGIASATGYYSAGTVEFLLEKDGQSFWFLEMNTRLQVEHPVTEAVCGFDLVQEMIRVAQGSPLSMKQEDVELKGHAIECRVNAENPKKNFIPNPGTITSYREPSGPGIRVDSGAMAGSEIPQSYDSLICKLIAHGQDRSEAIRKMTRALEEFEIGGIRTTIPFHSHVMASDWFSEGTFHTMTVEEDLDLSTLEDQDPLKGISDGSEVSSLTLELDGKRFEVTLSRPLARRRTPKPPDLTRTASHGGASETLTAPMQGTIIKNLVKVGDKVKAGDPILVLEAMKMENVIACHRDGVVKELSVEAGATVSTGAKIAVIEPE